MHHYTGRVEHTIHTRESLLIRLLTPTPWAGCWRESSMLARYHRCSADLNSGRRGCQLSLCWTLMQSILMSQVGARGTEPDPAGLPVEDLSRLGPPFVTADGTLTFSRIL